jgi:Tol biopolymer transport system component
MALASGTRVGAYEIVSPLGAGGMGEVYRARDARLNRDVALKVLPAAFASDPERLARFEREAQVLAAFKHPHIAAIHGLEEKDSGGGHAPVRALVLELVEGETLADLIARGPLPQDEALRIARQIADALEAAHEQGIVHRDLKPANIKITPDGSVKVLDFGLAKLTSAHEAISGGSVSSSMSPTMATPAALTGATVLMGTAAYMSPEQARGKPADRRADIWAFGIVLFEMLTARRVFDGESVTEVAGAIIHKEPDWHALPGDTPPVVAMTIRRCLQKDPRQRFRDIGDVRLALDGAFATDRGGDRPPPPPVDAHARRGWWPAAAAAAIAALATGIGAWLLLRPDPVERPLLRFDVAPADVRALTGLMDISPDGRLLAYVAVDDGGAPRLWVRSLETGESRALSPTEQTRQPIFWSPDSRYIAFHSDGKLKKVDISGGPAETIADTAVFAGGSWGRAGEIVYSNTSSIMRVPAAGGTPTVVTSMDSARRENAQLLPWFLPDGRHFLYLRLFGGSDGSSGLYVGSIASAPDQQTATRLIATGQNGAYAQSDEPGRGHVLFVRDGLLMAQAFDEGTQSTVGDPVRVGTDLVETNNVFAALSASANGTVAYRKGTAATGSLTVVDRTGRAAPLLPKTTLDRPQHPRLSPDGRRLAVVVGGALWVYDLDGRPPIKLTFHSEPAYSPLWTRDGTRIVYERGGDGKTTLFFVSADGSGAAPEPAGPEGHFHAHGWSADGEIVAVRMTNSSGDIVRFAPQPGATVHEIVATPLGEGFAGAVSPDGRWLAYTADPTGRLEIWVRPVSGAGAAVRVSPNGGNEPIWSRDGRELIYVEDRKLMTVPVTAGAEFNFKPPREMFMAAAFEDGTLANIVRGQQPPSYDIGPDGRLLMVTVDDRADVPISIIVNWTELLRRGANEH